MHLTRLRIGTVKNYMYYLQEGLPLKLQHIEMINANFLADKLIAVAKPFMKKEVYDMVTISTFQRQLLLYIQICICRLISVVKMRI